MPLLESLIAAGFKKAIDEALEKWKKYKTKGEFTASADWAVYTTRLAGPIVVVSLGNTLEEPEIVKSWELSVLGVPLRRDTIIIDGGGGSPISVEPGEGVTWLSEGPITVPACGFIQGGLLFSGTDEVEQLLRTEESPAHSLLTLETFRSGEIEIPVALEHEGLPSRRLLPP